ncbi:MAG: PAS domain S-box protein [Spirochaetales bacterium]|nr:PAS domain S-box protein [Spirochaetales bacterium]
MAEENRELQEYKTYIKKNLQFIIQSFHEFTGKVALQQLDIGDFENEELIEIFCNLNIMMDEFLKNQKDLEEKNKMNSLRADIWKLSMEKYNTKEECIQKLMDTAGSFLHVYRASFSEIQEDNTIKCIAQWCKNPKDKTVGLVLPETAFNATKTFKFEHLTSDDLTDKNREIIDPVLKKAGVKSFLTVPYPDHTNITGFLTLTDTDEYRNWSQNELDLIKEMVLILTLKTAQIKAEEALISTNEYLANELKQKLTELQVTNEKLNKDIMDRKQTELALRESEKLYRTLIQTSPDSIIITNFEYEILIVNEAALKQFKYQDESDLKGRSLLDLFYAESRELFLEYSRGVLKESGIKNLEVTFLTGGKGHFLAEISASQLFNESGSTKAVITIIHDLTRRKQIEDALAKERELFEITLRSINDSVITTDTKGRIILINQVAEDLTGYSQQEVYNQKLDEFFTILNRTSHAPVQNLVESIVQDNQLIFDFTQSKILIDKDGNEKIISGSGAPIKNQNGNIIGSVIVFRDITETQRMEEELFKVKKIESLGILAGGIAHDFNNILTGIITNLSLAKLHVKESDKDLNDFLNNSEQAALRASHLTNQLLTFSKGGAPIKEAASIKKMIKDAVTFCLSGSNTDYILKLPSKLWSVEVDPGQIDQVLNNIILNAKQAMPQGGILTIKAENCKIPSKSRDKYLSQLKSGKYVKVTLHDIGPGIPKHVIDKIFDPYFTTKKSGTGLGLSIAYSIIKKHAGVIYAESEPGQGSSFIFYLPASSAKVMDEEQPRQKLPSIKGKILVMDDDRDVRIVVQKLLVKYGYEVECTLEGETTIQEYGKAFKENSPYNLIIIDLTIPGGIGGKETAHKIWEINPDAKIIVFSGYSNDPVMANYREYGFSGVIAKPFTVPDFLETIRKALAG